MKSMKIYAANVTIQGSKDTVQAPAPERHVLSIHEAESDHEAVGKAFAETKLQSGQSVKQIETVLVYDTSFAAQKALKLEEQIHELRAELDQVQQENKELARECTWRSNAQASTHHDKEMLHAELEDRREALVVAYDFVGNLESMPAEKTQQARDCFKRIQDSLSRDDSPDIKIEMMSDELAAEAALVNPQPEAKFRAGQTVFHKKSKGRYVILSGPKVTTIEADTQPAYVYRRVGSPEIWIRPASEMEDGRFELAQ